MQKMTSHIGFFFIQFDLNLMRRILRKTIQEFRFYKLSHDVTRINFTASKNYGMVFWSILARNMTLWWQDRMVEILEKRVTERPLVMY